MCTSLRETASRVEVFVGETSRKTVETHSVRDEGDHPPTLVDWVRLG